MKKILGLLALSSVLLAGCGSGTMIFEGKEKPIDDVEEIIADQLEVENPDMDLEVKIYQETED